MTAARPPDRLDVPVERVAGGRNQFRRAAAVAVAIAMVVGGAFGLARWSEEAGRPIVADGSPSVIDASGVAASASARPSARSARPRVETLLPVDSVPLGGAPEVTLARVTGDDESGIEILVWTPDDARTRTVAVIPKVLPPRRAAAVFPVVAPDRRHLLVVAASPGSGHDSATVYDDAGHGLWTGDQLTAASGALWSADSRLVVVAGQPRQWHLVGIDRPGRAVDRLVTLPGDVFLPTPIPQGSISLPDLEPRTVPLGFSADGSWIYGGVISPELGVLIGKFRVSSDGRTVQRLLDFRVGQADGLAPRAGTEGIRTVDPITGRIATSRVNSDTTGGPRSVEVRGPDSAFEFVIHAGVTLGAEWAANGDLYALTANTLLYPDSIELVRIDEDGEPGPAILSTGPLTAGALIGVRDGYAIVALVASRPTNAVQLVAVDLAAPERITALPLGPSMQVIAAGLDR